MKNSIFFVFPYAIILKKYIQESETNMNKLYKAIEEKIKESGYPKEISGRDVYNDICDQIEDKENGTYLFYQNLKKMSFLNTILPFKTTDLILDS